jgi:hypothetical protein
MPTLMTVQNQVSIQNVFIQIINEITSSRLVNQEKKYCLLEHEVCCFSSSVIKADETSASIVINIIQKESNLLLERWIMSFDIVNEETMDDRLVFIQNVSQFISQMPAKTDFIEMYSIAFLNNNDRQQCHSYISTQDRIEFRSDAHLKAQRFHLPSLSLEVVYDDNASQYYTMPKKPIISLQSLSSPSFMSWSKMQHQQPKVITEVVHPLSSSSVPNMTINHSSSNNNNNFTVPIIAVRRLSRLSLSAIHLNDDNYDEYEEDQLMEPLVSPSSTTIPIPSPRMQYTHHGHRTSVAYSTSPNNSNNTSLIIPSSFTSSVSPIVYDLPQHRRNSFTGEIHHGCLVGSFEESLFSGRMSSMPSKPITFHCQIGVLGYGDCKPSLKCPPHWSIVFPAMFYKLGEEEQGIPYVGTVDISEHVNTVIKKSIPGYRIPPKGQLQMVIKNPNKTAVKLFLIPYDFTDMPKNTKTFLRQKSYTIDTPQQLLRYAIHIQVCRTEKKRIYLYKSMRIVFANRKADAREKFKVTCEGPKEPAYIPL